MAAIVWDKVGEHYYETGVDQGVFYPINENGEYSPGVAWNGLTAVNETPSGAEANPQFADNIKYLNLFSAEEFGATIEAFTYPDEFALCDGSAELTQGVTVGQQPRKPFGFCYRTKIGNDTDGQEHGYKLHLVYNAMASPSERSYSTVNDSPEATAMSWEITTTPINVSGHSPTALIIVDSTKVENPTNLGFLEGILYGRIGDQSKPPRMPLPEEVKRILEEGYSSSTIAVG